MPDVLGDLRVALRAKDEEKWLAAVGEAEREGYNGDQIAEALEETIKEDPVACYRFMEEIHRPPQAMAVLHMPADGEEWESSVHYADVMLQGAFDKVWSVYPRVPHEDPWADGLDKAHCEVVSSAGVTLKASGMASRF